MNIYSCEKTNIHIPDVFSNRYEITRKLLPTHFLNENVWSLALPDARAHVHIQIDEKQPDAIRIPGTHSADVVSLETLRPGVDGVYATWTQEQNLKKLAMSTADCLAVSVVTARPTDVWGTLFHAGWRGFTSGIHHNAWAAWHAWATNQNEALETLLGQTYIAISPAIFGYTYECGNDVHDALESHIALRLNNLSTEQKNAYRSLSNGAVLGADFPKSDKIYPDLQLLMAFEFIELWKVPSQNLSILRENTYGHSELASYRYRTLFGGNTKQRLFTHLTLGI